MQYTLISVIYNFTVINIYAVNKNSTQYTDKQSISRQYTVYQIYTQNTANVHGVCSLYYLNFIMTLELQL